MKSTALIFLSLLSINAIGQTKGCCMPKPKKDTTVGIWTSIESDYNPFVQKFTVEYSYTISEVGDRGARTRLFTVTKIGDTCHIEPSGADSLFKESKVIIVAGKKYILEEPYMSPFTWGY